MGFKTMLALVSSSVLLAPCGGSGGGGGGGGEDAGGGGGGTPCGWTMEMTGDLNMNRSYDYGILLNQSGDANVITFGDPAEGTPTEVSISFPPGDLTSGTMEADWSLFGHGANWFADGGGDLTLERQGDGHIRAEYVATAKGTSAGTDDQFAEVMMEFRLYDGEDSLSDQACVDEDKYDIFGP